MLLLFKTGFLFWQNILGLPETFVWKDVFQFKFNKIRDNYIKQYNFKLIHRILPSKDNLFIWKIVQSNECEICREKETIEHFIFRCKKLRVFWKIISRIIYFIFKIEIEIDMKMLLIGYKIDKRKFTLLNFLINYAQLVIYKDYVKRNFGEVPTNPKRLINNFISSLKCYLKYKENIRYFDNEEVKKVIEML